MNTRMLRAGMSGCGGIAPVTLDAARESRLFDVVAIQDPDPERLTTLGDRYGIEPRYASFQNLVREDLDFVILNGPNHVHEAQAEHAGVAGLHCLVQKPLAPTVEAAERMVRRATYAGVRLGVLMLDLGDPVHHQVKAMVEAGFFGIPTLVQAVSAHTIYLDSAPSAGDWRRDPAKVGGAAFIQLAVHAIDLAHWLLDERPASVFAGGARHHTVFEDETTLATVRFAGGALGHFAASYAADLYGFTLCGTRGRIHLTSDHLMIQGRAPYEGDVFDYASPATEVVIPRASIAAAVEARRSDVEIHDAFARWVLGEGDYPCPGDQGVEDLRVVDAAYRSLEERRWIDLDG